MHQSSWLGAALVVIGLLLIGFSVYLGFNSPSWSLASLDDIPALIGAVLVVLGVTLGGRRPKVGVPDS